MLVSVPPQRSRTDLAACAWGAGAAGGMLGQQELPRESTEIILMLGKSSIVRRFRTSTRVGYPRGHWEGV